MLNIFVSFVDNEDDRCSKGCSNRENQFEFFVDIVGHDTAV